MTNLSQHLYLPKRIACVYFKILKVLKNQHQAANGIGFIRKCLHNHITPKFALVKGQFLNQEDRTLVEQQIMATHMMQHIDKLKASMDIYHTLEKELTSYSGPLFAKIILKRARNQQRKERVSSLSTKNSKIRGLIIDKVVKEARVKSNQHSKYKRLTTNKENKYKKTTKKTTNIVNKQPVPVINLSGTKLSVDEQNILAFGLEHSFIDKNSNIKKYLAANMEAVADRVTPHLENNKKEDFHEFLRANTDIFTKNVYSSKDFTYSKLKTLMRDKSIAVTPGDKDSTVVVLDKKDYIQKLQDMIDDGIKEGIYETSKDSTLSDHKKFNDFLYRHFRKSHPEMYERMTSSSNQPAQLYGTAKTHKFPDISEISVDNLKFRPIISQVGTFTYNAAQEIGNYLKPLIADNDFLINNTQDFASIIKAQPPLNHDEEFVSYDVESLFTNVPIHETIEYILDEIYINKKLPELCKRSIFRKFLLKLTCENTFMFNEKFFKQIDGCTMGGPLSVIMSNIFMTMLEVRIVVPMKPSFYKRFVDDIITRRKKNQPDLLLEKMQSFHHKIKFTVEENPDKFLDTKIIVRDNGTCKTKVYRKPNKVPPHWLSKTPIRYKRNAITGDLHRAKNISSTYQEEVKTIQNKFENAGFPKRFVSSVIDNFNNPPAQDDIPLIPPYFFEEPAPFILIEVPYCPENERLSKHFIQKFKSFMTIECTIVIKWKTRKIRSLFSLKSKNPHPSCKLYEGQCSCGASYIGETKRNVQVRWKEHNDPRGKSEPAKHLYQNPNHSFTWRVIMSAPQNPRVRKNLEASLVALHCPP